MGLRSGGGKLSGSGGKAQIPGIRKNIAMKATTINFTPSQTKAKAIQSSLGESINTQNRFNIGSKQLSDFTDDDTMSVENVKHVNNNTVNNKKEKNNPIIIVGSNATNVQKICDGHKK